LIHRAKGAKGGGSKRFNVVEMAKEKCRNNRNAYKFLKIFVKNMFGKL
jgi:hypothetical protein